MDTVVIDDQYFKPHEPSGIAETIVDRLRNGETEMDDFEDLRIEREVRNYYLPHFNFAFVQEYMDEFKYGQKRFHAYKGDSLVKNRVQDQICRHDYCYL